MRYVKPFHSVLQNPQLLGGKGASLARMRALGLPIPPGFTLTTEAWRAHREDDGSALRTLQYEVEQSILELERELGRSFDDPDNPLLVSVRSGAPVSMPGMMDTILNLGLTPATLPGLAARTDAQFANAVYERLLLMFARIVRRIDADKIDAAQGTAQGGSTVALEQLIERESGRPLPATAHEQLREAIEAVWASWDSQRAKRYRRYTGIGDDLGTAVTVQAMVFGNLDDRSGTGVVFTRDPSTGSPGTYGDYLRRAQGEDIVAGGRNAERLSVMQELVPEALEDLEGALPLIEAAYRDMADVEFTVEAGRLWILQARSGQRSGRAAVRIAVDLVDEGLIEVDEAIERIPSQALEELQAPVFATRDGLDVIGRGTPAAPGAGVGRAAFTSERAQYLSAGGDDVVLIRPETSPEDIDGMIVAAAIVTAAGGRTSHAAVVARGLGRPAVCGVDGLQIDPAAGTARTTAGREIREGDVVAVDGSDGVVVLGAVKLVPAQPDPELARLLAWCDERARLPIVTDAPDGFLRVGDPAAAAEAHGAHVLVDVAWDSSSASVTLDRTVEAALAVGAQSLALCVPATLAGADLRPPVAPWSCLLVSSGNEWLARLLAARIPVAPSIGA
jgi:pyruvate,orthophosphate dikinase